MLNMGNNHPTEKGADVLLAQRQTLIDQRNQGDYQ